MPDHAQILRTQDAAPMCINVDSIADTRGRFLSKLRSNPIPTLLDLFVAIPNGNLQHSWHKLKRRLNIAKLEIGNMIGNVCTEKFQQFAGLRAIPPLAGLETK